MSKSRSFTVDHFYQIYQSAIGSKPQRVGAFDSGRFTPAAADEVKMFDANLARKEARREYGFVRQAVLAGKIREDDGIYDFALDRRVQTCVDVISLHVVFSLKSAVQDFSTFQTSASVIAKHSAEATLVHLGTHETDPLVSYLATHGMWSMGVGGVRYLGLPDTAPDMKEDMT